MVMNASRWSRVLPRFLPTALALLALALCVPRGRAASVLATIGMGHPSAIAIHPDTGRIYVAGHDGGCITVVDGATRRPVARIEMPDRTLPAAMALDAAANRLYVACEWGHYYPRWSGLVAIDCTTDTIVSKRFFEAMRPIAIAVNPKTGHVYVSEDERTLAIDGRTLNLLPGPALDATADVTSLAVDTVSGRVYVASGDSRIRVFDGTTGAILLTESSVGYPQHLAVNPAAGHVYATNSDTVTVFEMRDLHVLKWVKANATSNGMIEGITVAPEQNRAYVTWQGYDGSGALLTLDAVTLTFLPPIPLPMYTKPVGAAIDTRRNLAVTANANGNNVSFVNLADRSIVMPILLGASPGAIVANPDTNRIYVMCRNNLGSDRAPATLSVLDAASNSVIASVEMPFPSGGPVAMDPVRNRIYAADGAILCAVDGTTNRIVTTRSLTELAPYQMAANSSTGKVYLSDGSTAWVFDATLKNSPKKLALSATELPKAIAVDPVNNRVYIATQPNDGTLPGTMLVIDGLNDAILARIPFSATAGGSGLKVNPTTRRLYMSDAGWSPMKVFDTATNTFLKEMPVQDGLSAMALNPETNRLYLAGHTFSPEDSFQVLDLATETRIPTPLAMPDAGSIAVLPALGRLYVVRRSGGAVTVIQDVPRPDTPADAARALRLAAGLLAPDAGEAIRLNAAEESVPTGRVDLADATRILRAASGLAP